MKRGIQRFLVIGVLASVVVSLAVAQVDSNSFFGEFLEVQLC